MESVRAEGEGSIESLTKDPSPVLSTWPQLLAPVPHLLCIKYFCCSLGQSEVVWAEMVGGGIGKCEIVKVS